MIAVSQSILESLAPIVRPAGALGGGALSPKIGRRRSFSRDLGIPEADIEAEIDRAIKTADER